MTQGSLQAPSDPAESSNKSVQPLRILGYGFLSWFTVFAAAMALYPWRVDNRPLFEAVIPVVMVACTVVLMTGYLARISSDFVVHGLLTGVVWLVENLLFDWIAFSVGPMQLTFAAYVQDIGLTYLMLPVITLGLAWQRQAGRRASAGGD